MTLDLVEVRDAEILQGYYATVVKATNLVVKKNSASNGIWYNVTRAPAHGLIYVNDSAVNRFSHDDVERGHVTYVQTDFDNEADSFEFLLTDNFQHVIADRKLGIAVKPHLRIGDRPVQVSGTDPAAITTDHLDATDLSFLTGSDPIYYVTMGPTRGTLQFRSSEHRDTRGAKHRYANHEKKKEKERRRRLKPRAVKDKTAREAKPRREKTRDTAQKAKPKLMRYHGNAVVFQFAHSDVTAGTVEYVPDGSKVKRSVGNSATEEDSITFALVARNVQPTTAKLRFEITRRPEPNAPPGVSSGMEAAPGQPSGTTAMASPTAELALAEDRPEKESKNLLIVFLISGATVMALVGFVVFKCLRRKSRNKNDAKKQQRHSPPPPPSEGFTPPSPPPIAQPPKGVSPLVPPPALRHPYPSSRSLQRQEAFAADTPPSSPTPPVLSSGYVRIVSPHKDPQILDEGEASTTVTPGGTIKKEQVIFDWENVDPELLQHCRKTNPVLHKNQYWV